MIGALDSLTPGQAQSKSNHRTLGQCFVQRVGANLVFALLGAACRWAITRIAPTLCANLLWFNLVKA